MFSSTQYHLNRNIDTKTLYIEFLSGKADANALAELSKNYVVKDTNLLSFSKHTIIKHTPNIYYERTLKTYYASEPGYIYYSKTSIELLPLLYINKYQTKCVAVIPVKDKTKKLLSQESIFNALFNLGLTEFVKKEAIAKAIELYNNNQGGKAVLVQGESPVRGMDAVIELAYDAETKVGREDRHGKIDYKDKSYANNVSKGDLVAKYQPPIAPQHGKDIFGDVIRALNEMPPTYVLGEGLELDEENNVFLAARDGVLTIFDDKEISVSDIEIIKGNVDLNIGNLDVNGALLVKGDVCAGLEIKAKGNIQIEGNVEEASIWAGKNLIIKGGFIGNEQTAIEVQGNFKVGFVRRGRIKGGGDLMIKRFAMNSNISIKGKVIANHEKMGKIIGGTVCGTKGIDTCFVGNSSGIKTQLMVGMDIDGEENTKELENKSQAIDQVILKFKTLLGDSYFRDPKTFLMRLPKDKLAKVKQLIANLKNSLNEKMQIENEINSISNRGNEFKQVAIIIRKESYEGMTIQVGNRIKHFKHKVPTPTKYVYSEEQKDIIPTSVDKKVEKIQKSIKAI